MLRLPARAATPFASCDGFATARCFGRRRSLRQPKRHAKHPSSSHPRDGSRCAQWAFPSSSAVPKQKGRSTGITLWSAISPLKTHASRTLSVVARFAHLSTRVCERRTAAGLHDPPLSQQAGLHDPTLQGRRVYLTRRFHSRRVYLTRRFQGRRVCMTRRRAGAFHPPSLAALRCPARRPLTKSPALRHTLPCSLRRAL